MHTYSLLEKLIFGTTYMDKEKLSNTLHGKTILITGASSGIGEQLAYSLAHIKVHLVLVARREEKLKAIKQLIEQSCAKVSILKADLRNDEEVDQVLAYIHRLPNGLDIVVSNAGKSIKRPIEASLNRYHDFTRTMAINYFAPVRLILSLIPLLKKNKGQIINISTINALLTPFPYWAAYQASKSAFDIWLRSAAPELKAMGISTTTIYLPLVKTPMIVPTTEYSDMPAMSSEHVANIVCKTMYTRKKTFKPWWLLIGEIGSVLCKGIVEKVIQKKVGKRGKD